jgi:hypothetical protein
MIRDLVWALLWFALLAGLALIGWRWTEICEPAGRVCRTALATGPGGLTKCSRRSGSRRA